MSGDEGVKKGAVFPKWEYEADLAASVAHFEEKEAKTPPKKKLKLLMECMPYSSMKEYCKVQALWKMVGEDGIQEALKKREDAGGFSQCGPADEVMKYYKELLKWNKEWEENCNKLHEDGGKGSSRVEEQEEGGGSSSSASMAGSMVDWWEERQQSLKEEGKEEALKEEALKEVLKSVP